MPRIDRSRSGVVQLALSFARFMLLGVILSVGIAWVCAWRSRVACANIVDVAGRDAARAARVAPGAVPADFASTWRGLGVRETRVYLSLVSTGDGVFDGGAAEGREQLRATLRNSLPAGSSDDDPFMSYREWDGVRWIAPDADGGFAYVLHRRAGWPIGCMEQWWYPWSGARSVFDLSNPARAATPLPMLPMPRMLAASSAMYGALAWGVIAGAAWLRRRIRRRGGRCATCGYRLPDPGVCPECGASPEVVGGSGPDAGRRSA